MMLVDVIVAIDTVVDDAIPQAAAEYASLINVIL